MKCILCSQKGGSVAGKFGEINLKVILESAGFKKGVNYDEQRV